MSGDLIEKDVYDKKHPQEKNSHKEEILKTCDTEQMVASRSITEDINSIKENTINELKIHNFCSLTELKEFFEDRIKHIKDILRPS